MNYKQKMMLESINSIDKYGYRDKIEERDMQVLEQIKIRLERQDLSREEMQEILNRYNEVAHRMWQEYLTEPIENNENKFSYLLCNIGDKEFEGEFNTGIISTSLITSNEINFYSERRKSFPNGFIVKPKNIVSATYYDNAIDNQDKTYDEEMHIIQLPFEVEQMAINEQKEQDDYFKYRGKGIISGEYATCTEVACDDFEIEGYFFVSFGEGELSPVYSKAKRMADSRGLKLIEIDFSKIRANNGLEPMDDLMKRDLFKNMIFKALASDENSERALSLVRNSEFIEQNYKVFASKFLELKETEDFNTEQILALVQGFIQNIEHESAQVERTGKMTLEKNGNEYKNNETNISDLFKKLREELQNQTSTKLPEENIFSPQEIGRTTINVPTESKDSAQKQIQLHEKIIEHENLKR